MADLAISAGGTVQVATDLIAENPDGRVITRSRYRDLFGHPTHVPRHPTRMNHELGVRLYSA